MIRVQRREEDNRSSRQKQTAILPNYWSKEESLLRKNKWEAYVKDIVPTACNILQA